MSQVLSREWLIQCENKQTLFDDRAERKDSSTKKECRSTPYRVYKRGSLAEVKEQPKKRPQDHIMQVGHDKQAQPAAD